MISFFISCTILVALRCDDVILIYYDLQGKLNTYRFCDNVWTLVLNNIEFRDGHELVNVDKVKIVACDGKSE